VGAAGGAACGVDERNLEEDSVGVDIAILGGSRGVLMLDDTAQEGLSERLTACGGQVWHYMACADYDLPLCSAPQTS
jgi:hypothetical protein